jgi:hypothetical protein
MQSNLEDFKKLIVHFNKDGSISEQEYDILYAMGKELSIDKEAVDIIIKIQLGATKEKNELNTITEKPEKKEFSVHEFKSAITRGGSILTPDKIIIDQHTVTYEKRNKYLINVDTVSIPIQQISTVIIDTSILGTTIKIYSFGSGKIIVNKFTKVDAMSIKRIIESYQNRR